MKSKISKTVLASCIVLMTWGNGAFAGTTGTVAAEAGAVHHVIGEVFGGGIVFHVVKGADGKEHGLIVSEENLGKAAWGANTKQDVDAKSKTDGAANTAAIVKAGGTAKEAAGLCAAYEKGGFTDWYLPAFDELAMLYKNIKTAVTPGPQFCWSSTSEYPGSAIGIEFNDGTSTDSNKRRNATVRAIRAF